MTMSREWRSNTRVCGSGCARDTATPLTAHADARAYRRRPDGSRPQAASVHTRSALAAALSTISPRGLITVVVVVVIAKRKEREG